MDREQLEAMLRRRGYEMEIDERFSIVPHYFARSPQVRSYICNAQTLAEYMTVKRAVEQIDVVCGNHQHHMVCGQCGLPVLEHLHCEVRVVPWLRLPAPSTLEPSPYISREFRLVSAGPESEAITTCPQCGGDVQQTAREIED